MAQCGAYCKSVQSLRGQVAQLSQTAQHIYANLLLLEQPEDRHPLAQRRRTEEPTAPIIVDDPAPDSCDLQDLPQPMLGVRFASMSGPPVWLQTGTPCGYAQM